MFEFLFSYPREFFQVGELIPQTWGSATLIAALFVVGVVLIGFSVLRSKHGLHPAKLASLAIMLNKFIRQ